MKKQFLYILLCSFLFAACKKKEDINKPILGLEGDTWPKGPLDEWLYNTFTKPYNIEVKYRWDGSELALDKFLVPPREEQVQPLMEVVRKAWIDVYAKDAGEPFIKKFSPKQYVLVGSPEYNNNGTITLGQAEGGLKVTLFRVNEFNNKDRDITKRVLKTIHHEFAHILHQNIMYPPEFKLITPAVYTSSWNQLSDDQARALGCITPYASSAVDEDFVEMVAIMLTEGKGNYEAIVNNIPNATAVANIRAKENIVYTYFKQAYNINFDDLQASTQAALNSFAPFRLQHILGPGKIYSTININPARLTGLSADFNTRWTAAKTGLAAVGNAGRVLDSMRLTFPNAQTMVATFLYRNTAGAAFQANFTYTMNPDANGVTMLTLSAQDGNAGVVGPGLVSITTNYLSANSFKLDYQTGFPKTGIAEQYAGLMNQTTPAAYMIGVLVK
jgi:substrate import-associated zinc metallohydrolase lipoprotein